MKSATKSVIDIKLKIIFVRNDEMKRFFVFVSAVCCAWAASAQVSDEEVLLTINGKPSTVGEFLYIYEKNNQETNVEKKSIDEYLDLFINFKLKVAEAESLGIDTTESFRKELAGYRSQATPKYMTSEKAQEAAKKATKAASKGDAKETHEQAQEAKSEAAKAIGAAAEAKSHDESNQEESDSDDRGSKDGEWSKTFEKEQMDISKIKAKHDAMIKKAANKITGDLGEFIKNTRSTPTPWKTFLTVIVLFIPEPCFLITVPSKA